MYTVMYDLLLMRAYQYYSMYMCRYIYMHTNHIYR